MNRDAVPGQFDVILVMGVLECIGKRELGRIRSKLVEALCPRGYLLVGTTQQRGAEQAWWDGLLLRGGKAMNRFISRHPDLTVVCDQPGDFYIHTLLQKSGGAGGKT